MSPWTTVFQPGVCRRLTKAELGLSGWALPSTGLIPDVCSTILPQMCVPLYLPSAEKDRSPSVCHSILLLEASSLSDTLQSPHCSFIPCVPVFPLEGNWDAVGGQWAAWLTSSLRAWTSVHDTRQMTLGPQCRLLLIQTNLLSVKLNSQHRDLHFYWENT